jgi:hypothetical protein
MIIPAFKGNQRNIGLFDALSWQFSTVPLPGVTQRPPVTKSPPRKVPEKQNLSRTNRLACLGFAAVLSTQDPQWSAMK